MTVPTIPMLSSSMNVSSVENHKKIAAFLEATARHLEPIKYVVPDEEQSANIYQSEVDHVRRHASKDEGIV